MTLRLFSLGLAGGVDFQEGVSAQELRTAFLKASFCPPKIRLQALEATLFAALFSLNKSVAVVRPGSVAAIRW